MKFISARDIPDQNINAFPIIIRISHIIQKKYIGKISILMNYQ
jgi:hypothetical protein